MEPRESYYGSIEAAKSTLADHPFPVDVIVEPISRCNLSCIMCPQPSLRRSRGSMQFDVFKKIADEIARESPSTRLWLALMGESLLLRSTLIKYIRYAKQAGVEHVNLNTNACLLGRSIAEELIEAETDEIIIGLDAFRPETYNRIRRNGDFATVVGNVETLLELVQQTELRKPKVVAQFIVMSENETEVEPFKRYWLGRGAVVKVRPRLGWGAGVEARELRSRQVTRDFPCTWLNRTVSIHWNGRFAQCDADFEGQHSPGDIHTHSIKELWRGELARRRQRHWAGDFSHELCRNCMDWATGRSEMFYP